MNSQPITTVVLDTNVMIHCAPLDTLPWAQLVGEHPVQLAITPTVMREIDKLKQDGNQRRARRARRAVPLMAECERSGGKVVLKNGLTLTMHAAINPQWSTSLLSGLDSQHADDRLIAETWTLQQSGTDVLLLCNDTLARIRATGLGITAKAIPDDWLLKEELDERDKELAELREFRKEAENQAPRPFVELQGAETDAVLLLNALRFRSPNDVWVNDRVESYLKSHRRLPAEKNSSVPAAIESAMLTAAQIDDYHDAYDKFELEVRHYYRTRLCEIRNSFSRLIPLTMLVGNRGTCPAEGFVAHVRAMDGVTLFSFAERDVTSVPPRPPQRPKSLTDEWLRGNRQPDLDRINMLSSQLISPLHAMNIRREPEALVWDEEPAKYSPKSELVLRCDLLRHGSSTRQRMIACQLPPDANEGAILVTISCTNLPKAAATQLKFRVSFEEREIPEIDTPKSGASDLGIRLTGNTQ